MLNGKPQLVFNAAQLLPQESRSGKLGTMPSRNAPGAGNDFAALLPEAVQAQRRQQVQPPPAQAPVIPATPANVTQTNGIAFESQLQIGKPRRAYGPITGRSGLLMLGNRQSALSGNIVGREGLSLDGKPVDPQTMAIAEKIGAGKQVNLSGNRGAVTPTLPGRQNQLARAGSQPAIALKSGVKMAQNPENISKALQSSTRPLQTLNSLPGAFDQIGSVIDNVFLSSILSGDSTKQLLQAFNEVKNNLQQSGDLGELSAQFESGQAGIAAIGYDSSGGTSYGKYQIASKVGTMSSFIRYLDSNAPDISNRLRASGPANTGGTRGKMPSEWRKIAEEMPERFEELQESFIRQSHFEPAIKAVAASTGVEFSSLPSALNEVMFSTAVQHGPRGAERIFTKALKSINTEDLVSSNENQRTGQQLIEKVYDIRSRQFGALGRNVRSSVQKRLKAEMGAALEMLKA